MKIEANKALTMVSHMLFVTYIFEEKKRSIHQHHRQAFFSTSIKRGATDYILYQEKQKKFRHLNTFHKRNDRHRCDEI